ncbi:MAG: hypothetical protein ACK4RZ_03850 [Paracoccaceae bacterium]
MTAVTSADLDQGCCAVATDQVLSGRLVILRGGEHLALIAIRLRDLEAVMLGASRVSVLASDSGTGSSRARLQSLDLMIQELSGLSDILIGTASHLPDVPDDTVDALVDLPRLQSLSRALRNLAEHPITPEVVIF